MSTLRVILIGGPSNVGKSTLAAHLAGTLGWLCRSTDRLGRHPGRPWRTTPEPLPDHVVDHYRSLPVDALVDEVQRHYRRLWPAIQGIVSAHAADSAAERLVLEGSALWPETVATLNAEGVAPVWLTASNAFLQERIYRASKFDDAPAEAQQIIHKFVGRTHRYNDQMRDAVARLGLACLDVEAYGSVEELADACLGLLRASLLV